MALDEGAAISMTSLLFIGGVQLMQDLGPGIETARTAKPGDAKVRARLNIGEFVAGSTVLGAGLVLSLMAERWEPLIMAGVVVGGSCLAYEIAWRQPNDTVDPLSGTHMSGARG